MAGIVTAAIPMPGISGVVFREERVLDLLCNLQLLGVPLLFRGGAAEVVDAGAEVSSHRV